MTLPLYKPQREGQTNIPVNCAILRTSPAFACFLRTVGLFSLALALSLPVSKQRLGRFVMSNDERKVNARALPSTSEVIKLLKITTTLFIKRSQWQTHTHKIKCMNGSSVKTEQDGHGSLQQMYHIRSYCCVLYQKKKIKMHTRQKHVHA